MANIKTIRVEGIQHQIVDDTAIHSLQDAALTGAPTAPTPNTSDNSTRIATTAFVQAVAGGGGGGVKYVFTYGETENYEEVNEVLENIYNGAEIATYLVVSSSEGNDNIIYNPVSVEVFNNGVENLYAAMLDWSTGKVWLSIEVDAETGDGRAVWSAILPKPLVLEYGEDWSEFYEVLNDLDFPLNSPYVYLTYPDPTESFETVVVLAYYRASTLDSGEFYFGNGHTSISREYDAETGDYSYIWGDLVINAGGGSAGSVEKKEFTLTCWDGTDTPVSVNPNGWNPMVPDYYTYEEQQYLLHEGYKVVIDPSSNENQDLLFMQIQPGASLSDAVFDTYGDIFSDAQVTYTNGIKHELDIQPLRCVYDTTEIITFTDPWTNYLFEVTVSYIEDLAEDKGYWRCQLTDIIDNTTQASLDIQTTISRFEMWPVVKYILDDDFITSEYGYDISPLTAQDELLLARYGLVVYGFDEDDTHAGFTWSIITTDCEEEVIPPINIKLSRTKLIQGGSSNAGE